MIYNVIEVLLGIFIISISRKSLKKSVIRKWKEAFVILLFVGFTATTHGLLTLGNILPDSINNVIFIILSSSTVFSLFNISRMKGLEA